MDAPRVHVKNGWLLGLAKPGVQAFLGVPYAKPPLGDLRFLPPQPSEDWQGDYPATQYSDGPMQYPDSDFTAIPPYAQDRIPEPSQHFSENCLTLNVWALENSSGQNLPVILWIYGGAYTMGNAAMALYSGESLAR